MKIHSVWFAGVALAVALLTWPIKRSVYAGPSAYSSLSAGRPGTPSAGWAYILLEGGKKHRYGGAQLARFNLIWLLQGAKTGDGKLPPWINAADRQSAPKTTNKESGDGNHTQAICKTFIRRGRRGQFTDVRPGRRPWRQ